MKIVQINSTCGLGSTGKICVGISGILSKENIENYIFYSNKTDGYERGLGFSNESYIKIQALQSRVFGNYGFNSGKATKRMIAELNRIKPDIVHLHNIHGHDCNLEMLFAYFKKQKTKLIWTFHDCWAFTGYCPHFTMMKCDKWKTQCSDCIQKKHFSWFWDRSRYLFEQKKALFSGLDMTVVTPSFWLADLVKQSFLKDYPIRVIRNGIDLSVFKPSEGDFRQKYGLENKKMILGVSFGWGKGKGLDVFIRLSESLPKDYKIVLVGTDNETARLLPENILAIRRTQNQSELAEIYTAADLFVIPTREENYPTVNMEALACGTPVLTFRTGGSPEMLDETCGSVVECDDVDALEKEIVRICEETPYTKEACERKAEAFCQIERFQEYTLLYQEILRG